MNTSFSPVNAKRKTQFRNREVSAAAGRNMNALSPPIINKTVEFQGYPSGRGSSKKWSRASGANYKAKNVKVELKKAEKEIRKQVEKDFNYKIELN
jgi:hypothetical protein